MTEQTPPALRVWNNRARVSLPKPLLAWLGFLVATILSSIAFLPRHVPARWVLGGFIASHVFVFCAPALLHFTMRVGIVSLSHVVCWSPGLALLLMDQPGRTADGTYAVWSWTCAAAIGVSFLFDIRDAARLVQHLAKGEVLRLEPRAEN